MGEARQCHLVTRSRGDLFGRRFVPGGPSAAPRMVAIVPPEPRAQRRALRLAKRLCEAARNGDTRQLASLLDEGADPELPGFGGNTPLMVAAWNDRADCVALLLERGARADHSDPDYGYTPLLLAAQYGALEAAKCLVAAGGDLACRLSGGPDEGLTPRAVALSSTSRVYADPQPGRPVYSHQARAGRQRINSQHGAVAELLLRAERAFVGARQRLAFATCLLEGHGERGQRSFGCLPRNFNGGCDLIWSGERHAAEGMGEREQRGQEQLAGDEDEELHAAIAASLADSPAARCAWVHLHPPNCNCTEKRAQSLSVAGSTPASATVRLAARIAELEAAQQGARTGKFDFRELRRLKEEVAPLKKALIAQQEAAHRLDHVAEQQHLGRTELWPTQPKSADRSETASGMPMSIAAWLDALLVPQNVLAAALGEGRSRDG